MKTAQPLDLNSTQSPRVVLMIRPHHFISNPETSADNTFQCTNSQLSNKEISSNAYEEVTLVTEILKKNGVKVHLFEDEHKITPDSVFPNNWFSTHADGTIITYPMYSENRRLEVREDIINFLQSHYHVKRVVDYRKQIVNHQFLEGTGSMVLDHSNKTAFACISNRTTQLLFNQFCEDFDFEAIAFGAYDSHGKPVYHTNVMMSIATEFVLIAADMITDSDARINVINKLKKHDKEIIELSSEQVNQFAGNMLELENGSQKLLVMSGSAHRSLTQEQISRISRYAKILAVDIPTIEMAGGSIRCMLAGIHLPPR